MRVVDHRVAASSGQLSGIPQGFLPLYCQSLWSNHSILIEQSDRRDKTLVAGTISEQSA
jgi:hypothetical protein